MLTMKIDQAKGFFFDPGKLFAGLDKATQRILSKFGGSVRLRSKRSIKERKKPSVPGKPPSSRTGVLKQFIFYAYEPQKRTVVIGPTPTNQIFFNRDRRPVTGTVPGVLEYGGEITLLEVLKWGKWRRADLRSRRRNANLPTRYRTVRIAARPYMQPAFDAALETLDPLWRDSIR